MSDSIHVFELIPNRMLVTRQSARSIAPALAQAIARGEHKIVLDFAGVDGVTPSFLDEILHMLKDFLEDTPPGELEVLIASPPTRLSTKFAAVGSGTRQTL